MKNSKRRTKIGRKAPFELARHWYILEKNGMMLLQNVTFHICVKG